MYRFIHTKHTFSIAMRHFCQELARKVPFLVQGLKISDHQGVTRPFLKAYFHSVNVDVCSLDSQNFCTYLTIQNVPLFHTF